jgi:hypothetical protein
MWQDVPGKDEARLLFAQQTAQLLVRIAGVMQAYTDLTPRFSEDGVVNVWLTEKGEPGGESLDQQIYLYNIGTPRSAAEWVRELAHEYGHQTLPPVGGYDQPEWGASGLLGEQLLLRWLTLNPDAAAEESHPWVRTLDPIDVSTTRINPLIRQFANLGPNAPQWRGTDAAAMDGYLGMALYLEQARGSRYLALVLNKWMTSPTFAGTNGFLQSVSDLEEHVQSIDHPVVLLRLGELPRDIPYYVYLSKGSWNGELQGQDLAPTKVKCTLDGKALPLDAQGKFSAGDLTTGWHTFRVNVVADVADPELTALKLSKQAIADVVVPQAAP